MVRGKLDGISSYKKANTSKGASAQKIASACLLASFMATPVAVLFLGRLSVYAQWMFYDVTNMVGWLLSSVACYLISDYRQLLMVRYMAAISVLSCLWWVIDYVIIEFYPYDAARIVIDVLYAVLFLPLTANVIYRSYRPSGQYSSSGSYFVYKSPKRFLAFVASFVGAPYGAKSVVINGVEYGYFKGVLAKRKFWPRENDSFRPCSRTQLEMENKLGEGWSLCNNCLRL